MIYKSFQINVVFRVLMIVMLSLTLGYVVTRQALLFVPLSISLAIVFTVINLIQYIGKTSRDLTHFLLSVRQGAWTQTFTSGSRGKSYSELSDAFNAVIREFEKLSMERELHYQFLEALNENINIAILSFNSNGKLTMMNPAARRLLKQAVFSSMDHFRKVDPRLHEAISSLRPEERHVLKVHIGAEPVQVGIQLKEIVLQGNLVKIFTLQNLSNELEEQELQAWHQLMRVLTHEIMNSVTPIVSLSSAMKQIVTAENGNRKAVDKLSKENLDDLSNSIEAIVSRSKGLLQFVHAYKEYARPIDVHAELTKMTDIIQHVIRLFTPDLEKNQISLQVVRDNEDVAAMADRVLIEQVLINLLKNAIEAVDHRGAGAITVRCMKDENDIVHVMIADNGPGIEPDTLNKIFIPFYTTKPKGSGIGLSLCRQIMHAHGGTIRVTSTPGEGTVFTILWKSN